MTTKALTLKFRQFCTILCTEDSNSYRREDNSLDINVMLNDLLVKLFRNINEIEEQAIRTEEYKDMTANDMHVIEAVGNGEPKNMTAVARSLNVTTGTLTIAMNSLVKKGYVERTRSEEDRRVVLVSLTEKGKKAFLHHQKFHEDMIQEVVSLLNDEEKVVLQKSLGSLYQFFINMQNRKK